MRPNLLFWLWLILGSLILPPRSIARPHETGFLDRNLSLDGTTHKYQVFLPDNWTPKQKWPIILFLHGYGERGSDGLLQTTVGLPYAIRKDRSRFPTIVVMPQCTLDHWWTQKVMEDMALATLAAATKDFKGDSKRTYLVGLSMGGYASWDIASRYPGKFAAIVPVCGGLIPPARVLKLFPELAKEAYPDDPKSYVDVANKIGKTPVWIFHGAADPTVPVDYSRQMNKALKAAGGDVRYTEYPGVGHNSWDKAFAEPALMPWLLSKSLP
ncbi:MAG: prolyl oligopeptidase family serine peptidase [Candidatus Acidiferrum sp.]